MRHIRTGIFIVLFATSLLIAACATHGPAVSDTDQLQQRAQALWQAKVDARWGTFYDMTTSAYRNSVSKEEFLKSSFLKILSFKIVDIEVDPTGQSAKVRVTFKMLKEGYEFSPTIRDTWLIEEGQWFYQPPMTSAGS